jgi:hypothetical protein
MNINRMKYNNVPINGEIIEQTILGLEKLQSAFDSVKKDYIVDISNKFKINPPNKIVINQDLIELIRLFLTLEAEYAWLYSNIKKDIKNSDSKLELIGQAHTIYLFREESNIYSGIEIFKSSELTKFLSKYNKHLYNRFLLVQSEVQSSYINCFKSFQAVINNNQDKMDYWVNRQDKESTIFYSKQLYGNQNFLHCSNLTLSKTIMNEIIFKKLKVTDKSSLYENLMTKKKSVLVHENVQLENNDHEKENLSNANIKNANNIEKVLSSSDYNFLVSIYFCLFSITIYNLNQLIG